MMGDPVDEAIAAAQAQAFAAKKAAPNVVPLRGIASIPSGPVCEPLASFLDAGDAPVWVIQEIIQQSYVYALTAPTNHGKTAVSMVIALAVASGQAFVGRKVRPGRVLILCGENQDGFRLRLIATLRQMEIDVADLAGRVWVLSHTTGLAYILEQIKKDAETMGELSLVLVDTSVSFFTGDNENDNQQAYAHARDLRELSLLPGKPAVIVNCHPSSSAGKDMTRESCVPRGGSAFLNEIDTNLFVWSDGQTAEMHWIRKKRGPDFAPILWEFRESSVEWHGESVPAVVAVPITEEREKQIRDKKMEAECRFMYAMLRTPRGTIREWCLDAGFVLRTGANAGGPHVSFGHRVLERLKEYKLAERTRREGWVLTEKGKGEARAIE